MLERSIVDRSVGNPERIAFEAPPLLAAPLAQDAKIRRCVVHEGEWLITAGACPSLSLVEQALVDDLRRKAAHALEPERVEASRRWRKAQVQRHVKQLGISETAAEKIVERHAAGILTSNVELFFDHLGTKTVGDVLADPEAFIGETLADPIEPEYGSGKAKVFHGTGGYKGKIVVHSWAHGVSRVFKLQHDFAAVR